MATLERQNHSCLLMTKQQHGIDDSYFNNCTLSLALPNIKVVFPGQPSQVAVHSIVVLPVYRTAQQATLPSQLFQGLQIHSVVVRTSDSAFMALNISIATSTDKDRVDALALPYVK